MKKNYLAPKITNCETCIICGEPTDTPLASLVDRRSNYIEGLGQLCDRCAREIYCEEKENRERSEKNITMLLDRCIKEDL